MSLSAGTGATAPKRWVPRSGLSLFTQPVGELRGRRRRTSKPFVLISESSGGAGAAAAVAFDGPGLMTAVACSENVAFGIRTVPVVTWAAFDAANSLWMTNSGRPAMRAPSSSSSLRPKTSSSMASPVPVGVSPSSAALS